MNQVFSFGVEKDRENANQNRSAVYYTEILLKKVRNLKDYENKRYNRLCGKQRKILTKQGNFSDNLSSFLRLESLQGCLRDKSNFQRILSKALYISAISSNRHYSSSNHTISKVLEY